MWTRQLFLMLNDRYFTIVTLSNKPLWDTAHTSSCRRLQTETYNANCWVLCVNKKRKLYSRLKSVSLGTRTPKGYSVLGWWLEQTLPVDTHSCFSFSHTAICTIIGPTARLPSLPIPSFVYLLLLGPVFTVLSNCLSLTVMLHPALYAVCFTLGDVSLCWIHFTASDSNCYVIELSASLWETT
jgi:hypothetical protein